MISPDFQELHGDRMYADDPAIIGGVGRIDGHAVMFIGHQKGRDTKERVRRNYGMPKPEGYRKAQRLMRMAEKFSLPVVTFIDTPGAYPGVGAEERGQSEAIAYSLYLMAGLKTPIISVVIGEGGSGGALAIGVGDKLLMLQYSIYSVISPEGCASILWKSADKAEDAAEAMRITATSLNDFGLVDEVLPEPLGGAHRNPTGMAEVIRNALLKSLDELTSCRPSICSRASAATCELRSVQRSVSFSPAICSRNSRSSKTWRQTRTLRHRLQRWSGLDRARACAGRSEKHDARFRGSAMHIDHGLQQDSADWSEHCGRLRRARH